MAIRLLRNPFGVPEAQRFFNWKVRAKVAAYVRTRSAVLSSAHTWVSLMALPGTAWHCGTAS